MFEDLKEKILHILTSRVLLLIVITTVLFGILLHHVFELQIVNGEKYLNSFETRIKKEITITGARGKIYDRNGNFLAYNKLAYAVTIEDVYESGKMKNKNLNDTIDRTIRIIEENGDNVMSDFRIELSRSGNYEFNVEGTQLLRFLADVYGQAYIDDLTVRQKSSTADDVIEYLCGWDRFRIGEYTEDDKKDTFVPGKGYTKEQLLKVLNVRYEMSNNSFQKYITTTIATNVNETTVAMIQENSNELQGVSIEEGTIRKYEDAVYFSNIIGYTGKISSTDELNALKEENPNYTINDVVGKLGIEKSMERYLQGKKGSETIFVNSVGKTTEIANYVEAVAGNDIYLTIDRDLQITTYKILEEHLASILYSKIINMKEFDASAVSASKIMIPIYDVYIALFNNNVLDISHFSDPDAKENEQAIHEIYMEEKAEIMDHLREEFLNEKTPYKDLSTEYRVYESYILDILYQNGLIQKDLIDPKDPVYISWTTEEEISAYDYLHYCISKNYIDVNKLDLTTQYSDSEKIYELILDYVFEKLDRDQAFDQKMYKYMIKRDKISGSMICKALVEQEVIDVTDEEQAKLFGGKMTAYTFLMNRIRDLDITPAQLALDPCSASCVITDVNTGDVLALVSYPGFDNNKLSNGMDTGYYARLQADMSLPMINFATRHKTAPGSTFKMCTATAGLMEGVITPYTRFTCTGVFDKITPPAACWIAGQGSHGSLNVTDAIRHSCNMYFYELGYQMGSNGDTYSSDLSLSRLQIYADAYGLTDLSGVEIEESAPSFSTEDGVRSAIGQGSHSYTTVQLSRYVTTVANSGTCFDLTLISKRTDHSGILLEEGGAKVRNQITMDPSYWKAIHQGMRNVIESRSDYADLGIKVAGKTGTAEEIKHRANHALFVCYAPYDAPEISIVTRLAYGYSSTYAATTTKDILKYYFDLEGEEEVIKGEAVRLEGVTAQTD
ncbi:MAG: penicillin-binding protein [Lachnospiraceae bacterium]|nr:penicillin-binding protein [Lachnospiraceae bacterium]